jgi:hypothetical protein
MRIAAQRSPLPFDVLVLQSWQHFLDKVACMKEVWKFDADRKQIVVLGLGGTKTRAFVCCRTGKVFGALAANQWMNPALSREVSVAMELAAVASEIVEYFKPYV